MPDAAPAAPARPVPPPAGAPGGVRAVLGLLVACAAHLLIGADGLAIAIALPDLQRDLGTSAVGAQWALTAYGLALGGALLLGGRLGDLYGRRRLLVAGMGLFGGGSLLAALAPGLGVLVAARAVQGLGAAAAVPAALALIGSIYPPGRARTRALSAIAATASLGIMAGLLLGGLITDRMGWRWVFGWMTVPALAAAVLAPWVLPEARAGGPRARPDAGGALLLVVGLGAVLWGLTRLEHGGPTGTAVPLVAGLLLLVAGLLLLVAFVAWERRCPAPLVRLGVLRTRSLRAASLAVGANALAFIAVVYVGTQYLRSALGHDAFTAGLALLPVDAVALVVSLTASGALARRSPRVVLTCSFTLIVAALLWLARAPVPADYLVDVMAPLLVLGAAVPATFVVSTQQAVADVAPDEKGLASGVFETANHLVGGAVGVAVYATVLAGTGVAGGVRAAFLTAAGLVAVLGFTAVRQTARRSGPP